MNMRTLSLLTTHSAMRGSVTLLSSCKPGQAKIIWSPCYSGGNCFYAWEQLDFTVVLVLSFHLVHLSDLKSVCLQASKAAADLKNSAEQ